MKAVDSGGIPGVSALKVVGKRAEKKFKILKAPTKRIIYRWAYQCPKCKAISQYNFEDYLWALDGGSTLSMSCKACDHDQIFTKTDFDNAIIITDEEYDKLIF